MVVLDTCSIIELCKNSPGFSAGTLELINAGSYILSISFAEIACKIKLAKLEMSISPRALYNTFSQTENIQIVNISATQWLDAIEWEWHGNKDPADRVITAFAAKKELSIVSTDQKISKFYPRVIW